MWLQVFAFLTAMLPNDPQNLVENHVYLTEGHQCPFLSWGLPESTSADVPTATHFDSWGWWPYFPILIGHLAKSLVQKLSKDYFWQHLGSKAPWASFCFLHHFLFSSLGDPLQGKLAIALQCPTKIFLTSYLVLQICSGFPPQTPFQSPTSHQQLCSHQPGKLTMAALALMFRPNGFIAVIMGKKF